MFSRPSNPFIRRAVAAVAFAGIAFGALIGTGAVHAQDNNGSGDTSSGCKYASVDYKEGDKVKQDDGNTYRCHEGTWVLAIVVQPPSTRFNQVPSAGVFKAAQ